MDSDVESLDGRLEPDLEQVLEPDQVDDNEPRLQSDNDDNHSEAEEAPTRIPVKDAKTKIVKNPRPTLNPNRLTGPRGIKIIEDVFKDFQFEGKGYEKSDLDMVMKKLEHWAHRLYPKFQFDDCLEKIETLGKKKQVANHLRKIRLDLLYDETDVNNDGRNDDVENADEEPVIDEFDQLLNEQIALARSTPASAAKFASNVRLNNTEIDDIFSVNVPSENSPIVSMEAKNTTEHNHSSSISDEQRERMLQNRIIAEQKRLDRMKAAMEKKKEVENNLTNSQIEHMDLS